MRFLVAAAWRHRRCATMKTEDLSSPSAQARGIVVTHGRFSDGSRLSFSRSALGLASTRSTRNWENFLRRVYPPAAIGHDSHARGRRESMSGSPSSSASRLGSPSASGAAVSHSSAAASRTPPTAQLVMVRVHAFGSARAPKLRRSPGNPEEASKYRGSYWGSAGLRVIRDRADTGFQRHWASFARVQDPTRNRIQLGRHCRVTVFWRGDDGGVQGMVAPGGTDNGAITQERRLDYPDFER